MWVGKTALFVTDGSLCQNSLLTAIDGGVLKNLQRRKLFFFYDTRPKYFSLNAMTLDVIFSL